MVTINNRRVVVYERAGRKIPTVTATSQEVQTAKSIDFREGRNKIKIRLPEGMEMPE